MTNPLTELIPAPARKYVYGIITLSVLTFGAWQASEGNIEVFIGSLLTALSSAMALSNVNAPGVTYDGHGGPIDG